MSQKQTKINNFFSYSPSALNLKALGKSEKSDSKNQIKLIKMKDKTKKAIIIEAEFILNKFMALRHKLRQDEEIITKDEVLNRFFHLENELENKYSLELG